MIFNRWEAAIKEEIENESRGLLRKTPGGRNLDKDFLKKLS
jgi:hypothetical protein